MTSGSRRHLLDELVRHRLLALDAVRLAQRRDVEGVLRTRARAGICRRRRSCPARDGSWRRRARTRRRTAPACPRASRRSPAARARAPYAASAPAALPADGAASARAPSCFAIETATAMPRALNEPVGLRASSLTHTLRSDREQRREALAERDASSPSQRQHLAVAPQRRRPAAQVGQLQLHARQVVVHAQRHAAFRAYGEELRGIMRGVTGKAGNAGEHPASMADFRDINNNREPGSSKSDRCRARTRPCSDTMICRIWHGRTPRHKADAYASFLEQRAIPDYRSVAGNLRRSGV